MVCGRTSLTKALALRRVRPTTGERVALVDDESSFCFRDRAVGGELWPFIVFH